MLPSWQPLTRLLPLARLLQRGFTACTAASSLQQEFADNKAAVLHGPGDLRIVPRSLPDLKPDSVRIRLRAVGICALTCP